MDKKPRNLLTLGQVGAVITILASLLGGLKAYHSDTNNINNPVVFYLSGTLILISFILAVILLVGASALKRRQEQLRPHKGSSISLWQTLRLSYFGVSEKNFFETLGFQNMIVASAKERKDLGDPWDLDFRTKVIVPLLQSTKNIFDSALKDDVSVQLKLFPRKQLIEKVNLNQDFSIWDYFLENYAQANSKEGSKKQSCLSTYKLFQEMEVKSLDEDFKSFLKGQAVDENLCVSSAYNQLFISSETFWIANDLQSLRKSGEYFTDSPCFKNGDFQSQALFLIIGKQGPISKENSPFGVLVVESKNKRAFDGQTTVELGKYLSNRLFYFLRNSFSSSSSDAPLHQNDELLVS